MSKFGIPLRNGVSVGITAGVGTNSLNALAQAILRSFGTDASSYPFATRQGAFQEAAGPAAAAVDDPVGMMLDAMGVVGPEFTGGLTTPANWTLFGGATLNAGVAALPVAGAQIFNTIGTVSGNWYLVTFTVSASTTGLYLNAYVGGAGTFGIVSGVSDGVKFCYLKATSAAVVIVQNDLGSTGTCSISDLSCVQVTGNHATQTIAGNRPTLAQDGNGRYYASFDGSNSSLALGGVPFQMADDFAVVAATKCTAPANWNAVFSQWGAGTASISLNIDCNNGFANAAWVDDANTQVVLEGAVDIRSQIVVISLVKRGNVKSLRVNGVQVNTNSTVLGASTFTNAAIGLLNNTISYNGAIYDLDLIKGTVTDAQLLILEKAAAQRAGLVI